MGAVSRDEGNVLVADYYRAVGIDGPIFQGSAGLDRI